MSTFDKEWEAGVTACPYGNTVTGSAYAEGYVEGRQDLRKEIAEKLRALRIYSGQAPYVYASDIVALIEQLEAE